jgi:hypothetical protein
MRIIGDLAAFLTTKNAGPFLLTLGEKANPCLLHLPAGAMDVTQTTFEPVTPRAVRIAGTRFVKAPASTLELEGARRAGVRTLTIARTRDPILISQLDVSDAGARPSPAP